MNRLLPFVAALATALLPAPARADWQRTDHCLAWTNDGEVLWRFNYGYDAGKPYFHPLRVAGGPSLTDLRPADHPWHYGLWFSWKYVNGANYWEQSAETGRSEGATAWSAPQVSTHRDGRAEITLQLDYVHPSGRVDLTERRDLILSAIAADGSYTIDWTSTFTAGPEGALLDRTPLPDEPNGVVYGGYAGLSARLGPGETPVAFVDAEGPMTAWVDSRMRPRTTAVAATVYPDRPHSGSLAVLSHPANLPGPRGPAAPWYCINGQPSRFLCAAVLVPRPIQLSPHEGWTLRYRLLLRPEPWTPADLRTAVATWNP